MKEALNTASSLPPQEDIKQVSPMNHEEPSQDTVAAQHLDLGFPSFQKCTR
jgi:hypothetical protein